MTLANLRETLTKIAPGFTVTGTSGSWAVFFGGKLVGVGESQSTALADAIATVRLQQTQSAMAAEHNALEAYSGKLLESKIATGAKAKALRREAEILWNSYAKLVDARKNARGISF